jgi:hypothetical protein
MINNPVDIGNHKIKAPQAAVAKIFNNICPDIIFAKSRIAKLNTLALNEINSIKIIKGTISKGVPVGKKVLKNFNLFTLKLKSTTFIKLLIEKKKVNIIELVNVKLKGIKPVIFEVKKSKKIKKINGKKKGLLTRTFSLKIPLTNKYKLSNNLYLLLSL